MSPCPRKARADKAFGRTVLPTDPGEVIGAFDDIYFGVYPHTSNFFLSTLRTAHYWTTARKTRLPSPCRGFDGPASHRLGKHTAFRTHARIIHEGGGERSEVYE